MTGKFVVIEGLDGAGKSTLMPELVKHLGATQVKFPRLEAPIYPMRTSVHTLTTALQSSVVLTTERRISLPAN